MMAPRRGSKTPRHPRPTRTMTTQAGGTPRQTSRSRARGTLPPSRIRMLSADFRFSLFRRYEETVYHFHAATHVVGHHPSAGERARLMTLNASAVGEPRPQPPPPTPGP